MKLQTKELEEEKRKVGRETKAKGKEDSGTKEYDQFVNNNKNSLNSFLV